MLKVIKLTPVKKKYRCIRIPVDLLDIFEGTETATITPRENGILIRPIWIDE